MKFRMLAFLSAGFLSLPGHVFSDVAPAKPEINDLQSLLPIEIVGAGIGEAVESVLVRHQYLGPDGNWIAGKRGVVVRYPGVSNDPETTVPFVSADLADKVSRSGGYVAVSGDYTVLAPGANRVAVAQGPKARSLQEAAAATIICPQLTEAEHLQGWLDEVAREGLVIVRPESAGGAYSRFAGAVMSLPWDNGPRIVGWPLAGADFPPEIRRIGVRDGPATDEALESILAQARVIEVEDVGVGVTRPRRLTLQHEGRRFRALFKSVETPLEGNRRDIRRLVGLSDRWQHEVAAYELDRLLDLRLVPVTVTRTIDREKGALQFWVDGLVSFKAIAREEAAIEGICDRREQTDAMNVFDVLIHNTDRTQENMTYEKATGRAVLIDHSRSFRLERGIPDALKDMRLPVSAEWRRRLAALEDAEVSQALRPYLHRSQVASLLARRNLLMEMGEAD